MDHQSVFLSLASLLPCGSSSGSLFGIRRMRPPPPMAEQHLAEEEEKKEEEEEEEEGPSVAAGGRESRSSQAPSFLSSFPPALPPS